MAWIYFSLKVIKLQKILGKRSNKRSEANSVVSLTGLSQQSSLINFKLHIFLALVTFPSLNKNMGPNLSRPAENNQIEKFLQSQRRAASKESLLYLVNTSFL